MISKEKAFEIAIDYIQEQEMNKEIDKNSIKIYRKLFSNEYTIKFNYLGYENIKPGFGIIKINKNTGIPRLEAVR